MTVEILPVMPNAVAAIWPAALPLLAPSISESRGCYLPEDVLVACQMTAMQPGGMDMLIAAEGNDLLAAYTLEISNYPRKRVGRAVFAGGKPQTMKLWLGPMVEAIDEWCKTRGCVSVTAMGRRGWSKVVEGEEVATVLWRDFPDMVH